MRAVQLPAAILLIVLLLSAGPVARCQVGLRGTSFAVAGPGSSLSISLPGEVQAGELLLLCLVKYDHSQLSSPGAMPLQGWLPYDVAMAGSREWAAIFYKIAGQDEPLQYSFSPGANCSAAALMLAFWGADPLEPLSARGPIATGSGGQLQALASPAPGAQSAALFLAMSFQPNSFYNWASTSGDELTEICQHGFHNNFSMAAAWGLVQQPADSLQGSVLTASAGSWAAALPLIRPSRQPRYRTQSPGNWHSPGIWQQQQADGAWEDVEGPPPASCQLRVFPLLAGYASGNSGPSTSHLLKLPEAQQEGDLLLVFWTDAQDASSLAWPPGWTPLYSNTFSGPSLQTRREAFYSIVGKNPQNSLTLTSSGPERGAHTALRIAAGTYTSIPLAGWASGNSRYPTPPAVFHSFQEQNTLWIASSHSLGSTRLTAPARYHNLVCSPALNLGSEYACTATATRLLHGPGEHPGAFELSVSTPWAASTMALPGSNMPLLSRAEIMHPLSISQHITTGNIIVQQGGQLLLEQDALLEIPQGAMLLVQAGALLSLQEGALITGQGSLQLTPGASLALTGPALSAIQLQGMVDIPPDISLIISGNGQPASMQGLPHTIHHLLLDNPGGLTLENNLTITGTLTLQQGIIHTAGHQLLLTQTTQEGLQAASAGAYIRGRLTRALSTTGNYLFPVGEEGYAPLEMYVSQLQQTDNISVSTHTGDHPLIILSPLNNHSRVNRYWSVHKENKPDGILYDATFTWQSQETPDETYQLAISKWDGNQWSLPEVALRTANSIRINNQSSFSDFQPGNLPAPDGPKTTIASMDNACIGRGAEVPLTVTGFNNVGAFSLTIGFDPLLLMPVPQCFSWNQNLQVPVEFQVISNNRIKISWYSNDAGISLADGEALLSLYFLYLKDEPAILFFDHFDPQWNKYSSGFPDYSDYNDQPFDDFYSGGTISGFSIPALESLELVYHYDEVNASSVVIPGNLDEGFSFCFAARNHFLGISSLVLKDEKILQVNEYHPFYLDPHDLPETFFTWWGARGVSESSSDDLLHLWKIINGEYPIFYIFHDGVQHIIFDAFSRDYHNNPSPFFFPGDYPEGKYSYKGSISSSEACFSDDIIFSLELVNTPLSYAGEDAIVCDDSRVNLSALPSYGIGQWTYSGPSGASVGFLPDHFSPSAEVMVNVAGKYIFIWTEVNGMCRHSDQAEIIFLKGENAAAATVTSNGDISTITGLPLTVFIEAEHPFSDTGADPDILLDFMFLFEDILPEGGKILSVKKISNNEVLSMEIENPDIGGKRQFLLHEVTGMQPISLRNQDLQNYQYLITFEGLHSVEATVQLVTWLGKFNDNCFSILAADEFAVYFDDVIIESTQSNPACFDLPMDFEVVVSYPAIKNADHNDELLSDIVIIPGAALAEGVSLKWGYNGPAIHDSNIPVHGLEAIYLSEIINSDPVPVSERNHAIQVWNFILEDALPGEYTFKVKGLAVFTGDQAGKVYSFFEETIHLMVPEILDATVTNYPVMCLGGEGGIIVSEPMGGYGIWEVSLDQLNWFALVQHESHLFEVVAGNYQVFIRDSQTLCTRLLNEVSIEQPQQLEVSGTPSVYHEVYNISWYGASDGSISLQVAGGIPPYSFSWTGPAFESEDQNISGLIAGVYRVTVTDRNGCMAYYETKLVQPAAISVSGSVEYYKGAAAGIPFQDVSIRLLKEGNSAYETSAVSGKYSFPNIQPGDYTVEIVKAPPVRNSINTTDAALVNAWSAEYYQIPKVQFLSGDGDGDQRMLSNDATLIQQYFLHEQPPATWMQTLGSKQYWAFWFAGEPMEENPEDTDGADHYKMLLEVPYASDPLLRNFCGMVKGDFNHSWRAEDEKGYEKHLAETHLSLVYEDAILMNPTEVFHLPVRVAFPMSVGAISLILEIPGEHLELKGMVPGMETSSPLRYSLTGNELRISWFSDNPLLLQEGDILLSLELSLTGSPDQALLVRLADNPLNELADGRYQNIPRAAISMPTIRSLSSVTREVLPARGLKLTNYPNPFRGTTRFVYWLPFEGQVSLALHGLGGGSILLFGPKWQAAGEHVVTLEGRSLPAGVYAAVLTLEGSGRVLNRTIRVISY